MSRQGHAVGPSAKVLPLLVLAAHTRMHGDTCAHRYALSPLTGCTRTQSFAHALLVILCREASDGRKRARMKERESKRQNERERMRDRLKERENERERERMRENERERMNERERE